ncbi:hypothetical protein F5Y06DRAFT_270056 [Hypoxylon sp. FL0890]|nr:hypothetical protein F5Y06DRAFT_270056 [Hypoxylon sp. FL0890]
MAEEHTNPALGVSGAISRRIQSCLEGFTSWQSINDSSAPAKDFLSLLDLQRVRFTIWVQEWRDVESNSNRNDPQFCVREQVVMSYLKAFHTIFSAFGSMETPMLKLNEMRAFVSMDMLSQFGPSPIPPDGETPNSPTASLMHSIQWALQEDKLKEGLACFTTLLNNLYAILPTACDDEPTKILILSNSLATEDRRELDRISRITSYYPTQAALARTKWLAYSPQGTYLGTSRLYKRHLIPINNEREARFIAHYQGQLVLVEERSYMVPFEGDPEPSTDIRIREVFEARLDNIVARLQVPGKPVAFRTLPCYGGTFEHNRPTTLDSVYSYTYSIMYCVDYPRFTSLQEVLDQREKSSITLFSLGKRFVVARMLARALIYLHFADWLHMAIRSKNVVFFIDQKNDIQFDLPYLIGFDYCRPRNTYDEREFSADEQRLYRHPNARKVPSAGTQEALGSPGCYVKAYDIYSMGVVLLEIGLFATAAKIVRKHSEPNRVGSGKIRKILIEHAIPNLRFTMGEVYANAVLACLDGSLDKFPNQSLHQAFYQKVVCQLDLCTA